MTAPLDLSGYKCPLPVLKARKALKDRSAGSELIVICTDPAAPADFRAFCQAAGHTLVAVAETEDQIVITIRKAD